MGKIRVAIIGPIIIDKKSSGGEGEKLYQKLQEEGYDVIKCSGKRDKLTRLLDTILFMFRHRKEYDKVVSLVFSGRAIILEYVVFVIAKLLKKPVIGVLHGGALAEFYHQHPDVVEKLYNQCETIITPSKNLQYYFLSKGWNIKYIPNFIDTQNFPKSWKEPDSPKLLWVRGFHEIYYPELAIKCLHHLKKKYPNLKLTMVGPDMGLLGKCKQLCKELQLEQDIQFAGFVPNKQLYEYYNSHTLFLTTTKYESFGVALVEAASCGIPMVSTGVGEIPLLWQNGKEMLISQPENDANFFQCVDEVLSNTETRKELSIAAGMKAKQFTWDFIRERWDQILNYKN